MGEIEDLNKLFDDGLKMPTPEYHQDIGTEFIEPGLRLVQMAFRLLYDCDPDPGNPSDIVPRDQFNLWRVATPDRVMLPEPILEAYSITFGHLLGPGDEDDPETLMLNIMDPYDPVRSKIITFDKTPYTLGPEPVLLLVPRCCQTRTGRHDRERINEAVREKIKQAKIPYENLAKLREEESHWRRSMFEKSKASASSDVV
ncbi:hypothetical protein F5Y19DRAFT_453022 [Xylariaceae sp. FL1651]|nr:hypothetical protein F5Y19DRAFT_453022 [Xylariaceae sp. FL1651]